MSKQSNNTPAQEEDLDETVDHEFDIQDGDYGFVFSSEGELKHMFTPDEFYLNPPPVVRKILKALGIKDINALGFDNSSDTIH
jgi:hypothetical protein